MTFKLIKSIYLYFKYSFLRKRKKKYFLTQKSTQFVLFFQFYRSELFKKYSFSVALSFWTLSVILIESAPKYLAADKQNFYLASYLAIVPLPAQITKRT